jgi:hypothetical protein
MEATYRTPLTARALPRTVTIMLLYLVKITCVHRTRRTGVNERTIA